MFLGDDVTDEKGIPVTTTPIAILKPYALPETERTVYIPFNPAVYLPTEEEQNPTVPGTSMVKPTAKKTGSGLIAVAGGAVIGGTVAGPAGAFVGGIIGAVMAIRKG